MRKKITLGLVSIVTSAMLVGCNGGNDNNSGNTGATQNYKAQFEARSIGDQVEEFMGGVIGIADEVGHGKMGDPLHDGDVTLVESQFSWNSTMDFYNNISSIKHVWDGGLKDITAASQPERARTITNDITAALAAIVAISDSNSNGKLETSDLLANNGAMAFRNQILNNSGKTLIQTAIDKLATLQEHLQQLKPIISPTDAQLSKAAAIVDNVIVAGYNNLGSEAAKLETALTTLKDNPTAQNVQAARTQWRATREFWEAGEGHIFGPVDTLGVDPKVDSWPVDKTQLDGALAGWDPDLSNIDGFPVTMKGFHAIEYLLFGDGSTLESAADAATRLQTPVDGEDSSEKIRLKYLEALGKSFAKDIKSLTDAWK